MKCDEVQAKLSEYLDKSLDAESAHAIESHLSSCPRCRAEAESLTESIRQVAGLPLVDPPAGFTQRVMVQVREMAGEPSFWERFFLPLRMKLPIHAAALLLIGVFAVYFYQSERLEKKEPATFRQDLQLEDKNERAKVAEPPARPSVSRQPKAEVADESASADLKPAPEVRERVARSLALEAGSAVGELAAYYELVIKLRAASGEIQAMRDQLASLRKQAESEALSTQAERESLDRMAPLAKKRAKPETLWLTIPQSRYDQFKKELSNLGTIESESQTPSTKKDLPSKSDAPLRVKITILPPVDPETTPPADRPAK